MDIDRELLRAAPDPTRLVPVEAAPGGDAVPVLRFLAGSCRATVALVRFLIEVARDDSPDPIALTPRILRGA